MGSEADTVWESGMSLDGELPGTGCISWACGMAWEGVMM